MKKKDAIEYAESKGKIHPKKTLTPKEEEIVATIMKEGKIWGDPCCEIN